MKVINQKLYALAHLSDWVDVCNVNYPPILTVDWESVRPTLQAVREYTDEWNAGERVLLVELTVEAIEVERYPDNFVIRGEPERKTELTLF